MKIQNWTSMWRLTKTLFFVFSIYFIVGCKSATHFKDNTNNINLNKIGTEIRIEGKKRTFVIDDIDFVYKVLGNCQMRPVHQVEDRSDPILIKIITKDGNKYNSMMLYISALSWTVINCDNNRLSSTIDFSYIDNNFALDFMSFISIVTRTDDFSQEQFQSIACELFGYFPKCHMVDNPETNKSGPRF